MPPKVNDNELSEKEKFVLGLAWKCFESEPKINWEKLANLGGYTNQASAQNVVRAAKKKLMAAATEGLGDDSEALPQTPKKKRVATPGSGKGKNKRIIEDSNDADDEDMALPVSKKLKRTPKKARPVKTETEEDHKGNEGGDSEAKMMSDSGEA
ncbi:hypothetical protein SAMD00023353_2000420 [Rosellinia necatrix]|uniref:Uncharacterized protein n=1 Tax=Rosellinia necatrix TaxID=77044 RepID=A0A1W2TF63_ROSNE|nr:hypothetical protein SAMD00023353_2000420 [Rosellinia necatrix]